MLRLLVDKQPRAFIGENVKGLVSMNKGLVMQKILSDFTDAGYVVTHKILNASHYGIPQKRERVFIVGIRKDIDKVYQFPEPTTVTVAMRPLILPDSEATDYFFSERAHEGLYAARKKFPTFNKGRGQDLDGPCATIVSHLAKATLPSSDPVILMESGRYRRLTPLEAARIQSFPDNYEFSGSDFNKYLQIGNAIPPVLMWHIGKLLKEQLYDIL